MTGLVQCRSPGCESWFGLSPLEDLRFSELLGETETIGVECPSCRSMGMYRSQDLLDEQLSSYYQQLLAVGQRIGYLKPEAGPERRRAGVSRPLLSA
jgi:hypothetical protein